MEKEKKVSFIHYETAYGEAEDVIDKIQTSVHMGSISIRTVQFFTVQMHSHAHLKKNALKRVYRIVLSVA